MTYDATINSGETALNLASHTNIIWSRIDRRASQSGYEGCDANRVLLARPIRQIDGIDDYVESTIAQTITLPNGVSVVRPIALTLPLFWAQDATSPTPNPRCAVYIPPGLNRERRRIRLPTASAQTPTCPLLMTPIWPGYVEFVQAVMAHISAQWWAQYVTAFYIGTGYNTGRFCGTGIIAAWHRLHLFWA